MKKFLSIICSLAVMLSMLCGMAITTSAEDTYPPLPTTFTAPTLQTVYDYSAYNSEMYLTWTASSDYYDFYQRIYNSGYWGDIYGNDTNEDYWWTDYGLGYRFIDSQIQIDYSLGGTNSWHYDTSWDTDIWPDNVGDGYSNGFDGEYCLGDQYGYSRLFRGDRYGDYVESGNTDVIESQIPDAFESTFDGEETYYNFDENNNIVYFRARYIASVETGWWDGIDDNEETVYILSDWSNTVSYGLGTGADYTYPDGIIEDVPQITDMHISDMLGYANAPEITFSSIDSADMLALTNPPDEANKDITASVSIKFETSFDGEEWSHNRNYSIKNKNHSYDFYDLWEKQNEGTYNWTGGYMYYRAYYVYSAAYKIDDEWFYIDLEGPYSEIDKFYVKSSGSYVFEVNHSDFGYAGNGTETFSKTENASIGWFHCDPVEGCYVDTITINGTLVYDYETSFISDLIIWDDAWFKFTDDTATEDCIIDIVYGGTPTASYDIHVDYGNGGYISPDGNADNNESVYHGSSKTFEIIPNYCFNISDVKIDGVTNNDAIEDGEYTFENIDANHTIEASFERWAWYVDTSKSGDGQITCETDLNDGVFAIGESITYNFIPDEDRAITRVLINGVEDENAKLTGSYTITDIDKDYDIVVHFSTEPVVTHTVTVEIGEGGWISNHYGESVVNLTIEDGYRATVYFIPDEDMEIDTVTVDGVVIENLADDYYTIPSVTKDTVITVTFKEVLKTYVKGDVNGDGVLDILDVVLTRADIVGNTVFSPEQDMRGDMNDDGNIDIVDIVMMRKNIVDEVPPIIIAIKNNQQIGV